MRWTTLTLIVALIVLAWQFDNVSDQLKAETAARTTAEAKMESMITECEAWVDVYFEAEAASQRQAANTQACLDREAKAQADAVERKAILEKAKPRARTQHEQEQVVDDATRKAIIDRLNRPL